MGAEERGENKLAGAVALGHVVDREDDEEAEVRGAAVLVLLVLELVE